MRPTAATALLAAALMLPSAPAHAYLDAGTGSMMLQAAIGAIASAAVFGRLYMAKIKAFFSRTQATGQDGAE